MIILDASVLIALFDGSDQHHREATDLIEHTSHEPLGISPLTLAEVLVGPTRSGVLPVALSLVSQLGITTIGLGSDASLRLALLRTNTNLKLPDCCVLLAAEESGGRLATFDNSLRGAAERLGMAVIPSR